MGEDTIAGSRRRRPSMDDVAKAAGVSKGSVSKVIRNAYGLSPAMRERVEAAMRELGYRPSIAARAMRGSSFSIGLEIPNLGNEFFTQVMQGATSRLAGTGFQLMIAPGVGELSGEPRFSRTSPTGRSTDSSPISPEVTPEWLEALARDIPTVLIGRHDQSQNYDTVTNDDEAGTRLAIAHLLNLGHQRIAHLTLRMRNERPDAKPPHTVRRETYEAAVAEAGLEATVVYCGPTTTTATSRRKNCSSPIRRSRRSSPATTRSQSTLSERWPTWD